MLEKPGTSSQGEETERMRPGTCSTGAISFYLPSAHTVGRKESAGQDKCHHPPQMAHAVFRAPAEGPKLCLHSERTARPQKESGEGRAILV